MRYPVSQKLLKIILRSMSLPMRCIPCEFIVNTAESRGHFITNNMLSAVIFYIKGLYQHICISVH